MTRKDWTTLALICVATLAIGMVLMNMGEAEAAPTLKEYSALDYPIQAAQSARDSVCCSVDPDTTHYLEEIAITLSSVRRWKLDCMSPDAATADKQGVAIKMSKADATADTLDTMWLFVSGLARGQTTTDWQHTQVDTFWLRGMADDDDTIYYSLTVEGWE